MRSKPVQINLSEQEKRRLEILADRRGFSMSTYLRERINTDYQSLETIISGQTQINPEIFNRPVLQA